MASTEACRPLDPVGLSSRGVDHLGRRTSSRAVQNARRTSNRATRVTTVTLVVVVARRA